MPLEMPWAIDGPLISAATARQISYSATGGNSGVNGSRDLLVRQTSTPGTSVEVLPGSYTIVNRNAKYQSYTGRNLQSELVDIPASGTTAKTWYLGVEVLDPFYPGNGTVVEGKEDEFEYVHFVLRSSLTENAKTWLPLAKIAVPANTGTITNSMIRSLRQVCNPRFSDVWIPRPTVNKDIVGYSHDLRAVKKGSGYDRGEQFPDSLRGGSFDVECPSWATRMLVSAQWTSVRYSGKNAYGAYYLSYKGEGGVERSTQDFGFNVDASSNVSNVNWILNDSLPVPADCKGKNVRFWMRAFLDVAVGSNVVELSNRSGVNLQIRFLEDVDEQVEG